jgi:hypothetical protein
VPGIATPVATFPAQPNDTFDVMPTADVFVRDGSYEPGQVIADVTENVAIVSFAGTSRTRAVVTQGSDGRFTTSYY